MLKKKTEHWIMMSIPLTLSLFPKAAKKGFVCGGKRFLMSVRHSILNFSGFFSMTSLKREKQNYRLKISKTSVDYNCRDNEQPDRKIRSEN